MKTARSNPAVGILLSQYVQLVAAALAWWLGVSGARGDGCFVFRWNKQKDINEPTQKAILLYDQGREDLVLQVKYEGPAEDFGWLIPVPGLPEVRKGSMDCFYELSKLTQERFGENMVATAGMRGHTLGEGGIKVIEIKTVGAYEVAVVTAGDAARLSEWLGAHQFAFPAKDRSLLDSYIKKQWYFVAARVIPDQTGFTLTSGMPKQTSVSPATRAKLASGELHPLVISFPADRCVFPLAISAVNGKPSEVSLYVLSAEPLLSQVIFEKKLEAYRRAKAEWIRGRPEREKEREAAMNRLQDMELPSMVRRNDADAEAGDPRPNAVMRRLLGTERPRSQFSESDDEFWGGRDLVWSLQVSPKVLTATTRELPRLKGRSWWLTKQVQTFAVEEMRDLEFELAVPVLTNELRTAEGPGPAHCLAQFGPRVLPFVLAELQNTNPLERHMALAVLTEMGEGWRWRRQEDMPAQDSGSMPGHSMLVPLLLKALRDDDPGIRQKACEAAAANWDPAFVGPLTERLLDSDGEVRSMAAYALKPHAGDLASQLPAYRKMIHDDGPGASQAMQLLTIGHEDALSREELVRLFSSTNLPVVSMAFSQLRRQDLTVGEIAPLLANPLPLARLMGINALVQIGNKEAAELIVSRLRDPNEAVRWMVRSRLRRLTGQKLGSDPAAWEAWWAENKGTFTPPAARGAGTEKTLRSALPERVSPR